MPGTRARRTKTTVASGAVMMTMMKMMMDREAMKAQIWGRQANPAPSFLAPGFPASNTEELASIQAFDPELGKQLLADIAPRTAR